MKSFRNLLCEVFSTTIDYHMFDSMYLNSKGIESFPATIMDSIVLKGSLKRITWKIYSRIWRLIESNQRLHNSGWNNKESTRKETKQSFGIYGNFVILAEDFSDRNDLKTRWERTILVFKMNSESLSGILDCPPWLWLEIRQKTKENGNDESLSRNVQEEHPKSRTLDQVTEGAPVSTEVAKQLPPSSQHDSNDLVHANQESSDINYNGQPNQGGDEAYLLEIPFNL